MSVRRVNCPSCNAALNVPATMANIRCSQCSTVWDVNNPPSVKAAPKSQEKGSETATPKKRSEASKRRQAAMIAVAGSFFTFLALAAIAAIMFTGGEKPTPAEPEPQIAIAEQTIDPGDYRVVKLPESTRRNIYRDYRLTAGSSVEKKVMVPKDSVAAQTLGKTMNALVNREVTHLALLNNITDDDVMQIVAEGNAKGWPPQRKTTPANNRP